MTEHYSAVFLLSRLQTELNRLFREFMHFGESTMEEGAWAPRVDVVESNDAIVILAEVPGVAGSDLKVEVAGNVVTLSGWKHSDPPSAHTVKFHRVERGHGRFTRRIQLLRPINGLQAEARLAAGLLTVSFPKIAEQRERSHVLEIHESEDSDDD